MACVLANIALTPAERECCIKMAGQCGDMGMAKSHPCCEITAPPTHFDVLKTATLELQHATFVLIDVLPSASPIDASGALAQLLDQPPGTQSPPGLQSTTITILRI